MTWILALALIPIGAAAYRLRGSGWRGPGKWTGLAVLCAMMAYSIGWVGLLAFAGMLTGRAGHGEFYHDGMQDPPRRRQDNDWIGWLYRWPDGRSVWADRVGLGLTGLLLTGPASAAALGAGLWGYAAALGFAGLIGKPLAYAIGWRLFFNGPSWFRQTVAGEWLFGMFVGLAAAIGVVL